jgi:hypothetical protein
MQKILAMAGVVCIATAAMIAGDIVTSRVSVDGSAWISSAVTGDTTYSGNFMTNERAIISRIVDFSDGISAQTRAVSSGPLGIGEFSSQFQNTGPQEIKPCVFLASPEQNTRYDEISTSGLMKAGDYQSIRVSGNGISRGSTNLQGDGMVSLKKASDTGNMSHRERSVIAGEMNVSEFVEYGNASWISPE